MERDCGGGWMGGWGTHGDRLKAENVELSIASRASVMPWAMVWPQPWPQRGQLLDGGGHRRSLSALEWSIGQGGTLYAAARNLHGWLRELDRELVDLDHLRPHQP